MAGMNGFHIQGYVSCGFEHDGARPLGHEGLGRDDPRHRSLARLA